MYQVERNVREETNDYGKAGEVEWHLMSPEGECIEVYGLKRLAINARDVCNGCSKPLMRPAA
jgi:hypothetical protein